MSTEYDIFGQGAQPLPDLPAPELTLEDETDDIILPPLTLNTHHSTLNEWFY